MNDNHSVQPTVAPIIACTTYRKRIPQAQPIDVYGLMPSYTEAINAAGGIPLLIPLGLSESDLATIIRRSDGVLLPGGGDIDPAVYGGNGHADVYGVDELRDQTELFVAQEAIRQSKPILAICRGIQILNVALGGTLWEDVSSMMPGALKHEEPDSMPRNHLAHVVHVSPNSCLDRCVNQAELWVNSLHHQGLRELAPGLQVTATAPDGLIEAVEVPGQPFALGVQWHPENLIHDDQAMLSLFEGLVQAAAERISETSIPNG